MAPRSADSTAGSGRLVRGAPFGRLTDSGLPDKAQSLFEDARGQLWVGTQNGVAFLKSDRFVPVASVPLRNRLFLHGGQSREPLDESSGRAFPVAPRACGRTHSLGPARAQRTGRAVLQDAVQGGLWLGFRDGGVAHFKDGQLRASYAGAEGLGEGEVRGFYVDRNGTLWAPTVGGLSRIKGGHILTLTSQNGLPCNTVHWMIEDDARSVWLYLACGLVRIGWSELDAWASHRKQTIHATVFDRSDGVTSHRSSAGFNSVVAKSSDGKLWFVRNVGVSVIDPHHLPFNEVRHRCTSSESPPMARPTTRRTDCDSHLELRDLTIDYTALSSSCRRKCGSATSSKDRTPLEGGRQRQPDAILESGTGDYLFRVSASNNSGVWNETGAYAGFLHRAGVLPDALVPAFCRRRGPLSHVGWVSGARSPGRASVPATPRRTRQRAHAHRAGAARHAAAKLPRPAVAIEHRDGTCCQIARQTRKRNSRLRLNTRRRQSPKVATRCRACARPPSNATISRSRSGPWATSSRPTRATSRPHSSVAVEGQTRDLHPIVRDEIFKIAAEALRNAFRHAHAGRVEVEIRYDEEQFRLRVRDDGRGIKRDGARKPGLGGTLRPARHAGTRRTDRRETGGVE